MCRLFLSALLLRTFAFAASPADYLPPAPAWHGASEALIAKSDNPWITPAEKTGLTDSPNYDDTIDYLKRLCVASPCLRLVVFGQTAQGRDLYLVVASKEGADNGEDLAKNQRPTLLAQAGIHAGEIDGKDAGLMLLRDIAFGGKAALLDGANFLFVPVFNADGHERSSEWNRPNQRGPVHQGWRTTAQNLNLNRDYVKADSPEMRAMIGLLNDWEPELYLDLHVTDGVDYQYDVTFGYNTYQNGFTLSPKVAGWMDAHYQGPVTDALAGQGHIPGPLVFATNNRDLTEGIFNGVATARFANGYGDARHIASVLVENHSLKPYKQRVLGMYVLLEASLKTLAEHGRELREAIESDEAERPGQFPANWGQPGNSVEMDFAGIASEDYVSPASGTKEVRWLGTPRQYPHLKVVLDKEGVRLHRPRAYYVPVTRPDLIDRLRLHGIEVEEFDEGKTVKASFARLVGPKSAAEPFEGHFGLTFSGLKWEERAEFFPAGSVRVSTDQPLGNLAMLMLEPESNESFLQWGFFPEILQRTEYIEGYVVAPMAEKMLADDPKLKAEFRAKLAADPKFAADPTARLQWFYERSRFYDDRYLLYPVGIER
jgi:murein tripeptide amidase MpaA